MPARINVVGVWSSIHIHHGRIFLRWIETYRLNHSPVQIGGAIVGFQRAGTILRNTVTRPWVFRSKPVLYSWTLGSDGYYVYFARHRRLCIVVYKVLSTIAKRCVVVAFAIIQEGASTILNVHSPCIALYGAAFVRHIDDGFRLVVKA